VSISLTYRYSVFIIIGDWTRIQPSHINGLRSVFLTHRNPFLVRERTPCGEI
jgi:hypothetical protein